MEFKHVTRQRAYDYQKQIASQLRKLNVGYDLTSDLMDHIAEKFLKPEIKNEPNKSRISNVS